ncbi:MAG TPA: hypothetical protein VFL54_09075 [Gammaproteobacteria bacterium]|nr:hypothetical protein [Gammaproteobacteria bacterium]
MTPADFDRAAARTRMRSRSLAMARRYLVDGMTNYAAIAREFNVHATTVEEKVRRIRREVRLLARVPAGWTVKTVVVPPMVALKIDRLRDEAWRDAGLLAD